MADESELRSMLQREAAGAGTPELDPGRIVRRTKARRLPRQLAAGGALTLAVLALGVGTVSGIRLLNPPAEMSSAGGSGETTDEEAETTSGEEALPESGDQSPGGAAGGGAYGGSIELAPAYKINTCGKMLGAVPGDGLTGVSVGVDFPDEAAAGDTVRGTVEVTNDTGEPLRGVMSDVAATTLSQDGTVLWHTPRLDRTLPVDLDPGESTTLEASFEPRVCSPEDEDEGMEGFRPDLPAVDPGAYEVSVAFDIEREDGFVLQVVSGTESIALH
jgi:hypothetical protein